MSIEHIPAYCITRDDIPQRVACAQALQQHIPQLEIIPAIIGAQINKTQLTHYLHHGLLDRKSISFAPVGEIGCYLSHITVLRTFLGGDSAHCIVFEDDIRLLPNFCSLFNQAWDHRPTRWDLLYLYAKKEQKEYAITLPNNSFFLGATNTWLAMGYIVNRSGAEKIIRHAVPMNAHPIDAHFVRLVKHKRLSAFIVTADLAQHTDNIQSAHLNSTIQQTPFVNTLFYWQSIYRWLYPFYFYSIAIPYKLLTRQWGDFAKYGRRTFFARKRKVQ